ncbi:hypothetical protein BCT40_06645 [Vibrio lentus]|nr:hypothetical protein BCV33_11435 [Vibrio lentus]PMG60035.1 hypothetical protein BCU87_17335 [Vibrio lentus]PMM99248.1 hypothetical protein BCT40_06645 [Vibrio lentus]
MILSKLDKVKKPVHTSEKYEVYSKFNETSINYLNSFMNGKGIGWFRKDWMKTERVEFLVKITILTSHHK